jgi:hypothetical protein
MARASVPRHQVATEYGLEGARKPEFLLGYIAKIRG